MDLEIEGRHALLFDDDVNAAFVNSRAALVPWIGDESVLIDRYDVRHLLDRIPPRPKKQRFVEETSGVSQTELDRERFLDFPLNDDDEGGEERETTERSEATGSYQAVPFSYINNDGSADPGSSGLNNSAFHPPFPVPTSLLSNLPPTEKLHQIMARTAIFVSEHGGQSEIVLRVKQGDNPTFGFLMPDNQLHPYFRFLVDHPQLLKSDSMQDEKKSNDRGNEALVATGGALSLLGSVYGTGEDDDNTPQQESNEGQTRKLNADDNSMFPHKSVKEESTSSLLEDKEPIKRTVAAPTKEKSLIPKRNHFVNSGFINKKGEVITSQHGIVGRPSSQSEKTDAKSPILEPPSFLKRTIDKIVEFIRRNGKEFEAVLIEQDKTAGRFPFLLSSNQYHSYYLKVLQEALESKSLSKNSSDGSKRRAQEAVGSGSTADEELEGWSLDLQRKEKFKMVIGSKKESNDQLLKPVRQSGATADEAAAIVLAATRGRSPASTFQNTSVADTDTGRASSIGSLSLHKPDKTISNPLGSNGEAGDVAVAAADVAVATIVAKTVALATAGEADSSEASLTKEQKLKAERLKRAKMFAAMIKSGVQPTTQLVNSGGTPNDCVVPSTAGSNHEEREGSSVPFDAEASGRGRNYRKKQHSRSKDNEEDSDEDHKHSRKKHRSADDHKHHKDKESRHHDDHKRRKDKVSRHHHSRSHHKRHNSDAEDELRYEESHRHCRSHHKHHNSDSEDEHRYEENHHHRHRRHKHHSASESEDRHEKSSRHRQRHRRRDLSDDEDRNESRKHRRKQRSPSEKRDEIEEGEVCEKSFRQSEEAGAATALDAKPSDVTEVPSDLRAKIRAMLLETI